MQLNQDQDLLADLSIAICSSFIHNYDLDDLMIFVIFFVVFQYDLGPPKHTLELRNFVFINVFSLHLLGPNGENWGFEGVFISFSYTFSHFPFPLVGKNY